MANTTPADHLAWAICATQEGVQLCQVPCAMCRAAAAAVLRVAVEQVVPEPPDMGTPFSERVGGAEDRQRLVRFRMLAIAAELVRSRMLASAAELEAHNA